MKSVALVLGMFLIGLGLASVIALTSIESTQKKDEPTPVQVGVMSQKQKAHSKLYKEYSAGRKLDISLPETHLRRKAGETQEESVYIEPGTPVTSPDAPVLSFVDLLKDLSCGADAVVIAVAKDRVSQLTESKEFIFSDYVVTVEEVFQNKSSAYITPNSDIIVTRPGGKIQINGRIVNAVDASFKLLEIGQRYLLFLKYIPETGAYQSIRKGSFLTQDNNLVALTEEFIPGDAGDTRTFGAEVRGVLYSGCDKNK